MVQVCVDAGGNEHTAVAAIPGGLARAVALPLNLILYGLRALRGKLCTAELGNCTAATRTLITVPQYTPTQTHPSRRLMLSDSRHTHSRCELNCSGVLSLVSARERSLLHSETISTHNTSVTRRPESPDAPGPRHECGATQLATRRPSRLCAAPLGTQPAVCSPPSER